MEIRLVRAVIGIPSTFSPSQVSATATFLLNFTDVDPGLGTPEHVMPGLTLGLRF